MEIHNISEDIVYNSVQKIFELLKTDGNPEGLCLCEQCKMDTVCYALNRVEPRYVISNRGIARMEQDWIGRQQTEADIASLIYKGIRLVNHNQRPTASHDDTVSSEKTSFEPAFDLPTIVGRIFDGETFAPLTEVTIELRCEGEIVPMRNRNWQNPFTLIDKTPGAYSFWPAPVPAEAVNADRVFTFSLKIESENYETTSSYFKIPVVSSIQSPYAYSLDRTFKVPDIYLFPPGEAELNG